MPGIRHLSKLDELGDSVRQVIKAYHGSPHNFDSVDISKIGTGEGNAAYGVGFYTAGNEPTARYYENALTEGMPYESPEQMAAVFLRGNEGDRALARRELSEDLKSKVMFKDREYDMAREAMKILLGSDDLSGVKGRGTMYEMEIAHSPDSLLQYEVPLKDQPEPVLESLRKIGVRPDDSIRLGGRPGRSGSPYYYAEYGPGEAPGGEVYKYLQPQLTGHGLAHGSQPAYRPFESVGTAHGWSASRALQEAGIPGVQYLDSGSREAGSGSYNQVWFPGTEDSIRILRKYGMMAPIAAGAAAGGGDE